MSSETAVGRDGIPRVAIVAALESECSSLRLPASATWQVTQSGPGGERAAAAATRAVAGGAEGIFGTVDLAKVPVFSGALLGATLVCLFSALAIRAVGRTAQTVIQAVRQQFREHPGIMTGKEKPDYAACVDIVTRQALVEMIAPGLLAVLAPIVVGIVLKAESVAAMKKAKLTVTTLDPKARAEFEKSAAALVPSLRGRIVPADMYDLAVKARDAYRAKTR